MNILHVTPAYKPAYRFGGPAVCIPEITERLAERGHRVVVFTTNGNLDRDLTVPTDRPVDVNGVEVWYFKREEYLHRFLPFLPYLGGNAGYCYAPAMKRQLDRILPGMDMVHCHMPFFYTTYLALRMAHRHNIPLVYHQHAVLTPEDLAYRAWKKKLYLSLFELPGLRYASRLIALNSYELEAYRMLGLSRPCSVIPNGIDIAGYLTEPEGNLCDSWDIDPDALVVLFMGRLHPRKHPERVVEAFISVCRDFPRAVLVIAGPDQDGMEMRLQSMVRKAGIISKVCFTGMVEGRDQRELLARADLFCLLSDVEGSSISLLEALASSTAVLVTEGCMIPEVVEAGAGVVVPARSAEITLALAQLLSVPARLTEMGRRGREFVSEQYSWGHIISKLLSVYDMAIKDHDAGHDHG